MSLRTQAKGQAKGKQHKKGPNKANDTDHHDVSADENIRLPHRIALSAFSKSVGHRPMGIQVAQVRMCVERFIA